MAILQPQPKSLEEILTRKMYHVPVYQRVFSWTKIEAEELWNDLIENDAPYFLGIMILKPQELNSGKSFEVVDGQQRLATLILMLRAAVETLDEESDSRRNDIQKNYVMQKKLGRDEYDFTLTLNERDKYKFQTLLDDNHEYAPEKGSGIRKSSSWKNLQEVLDCFKEKFKILKTKGGLDAVFNFVISKVLTLEMLDVQLESDSDVYQFFETINDRGIDLSLADLVKNRACSVVGKDLVYTTASKIDQISDLIGYGKMKPFLLHYCWALAETNPPPMRNRLMDWYNETITHEKADFLNKLTEYSQFYFEFIEPRKVAPKHSKEVLTFLKVLGATRCYPLLLVGRKILSAGDFTRLCKAVEILTVRHSTIAKKDAKNLEDLYQDLAHDIKAGFDFDKIIGRLRDQSAKISDQIFEANFKEYEEKNLQIAKYILNKIDNFLTGEKSVHLDWEALTLEHILAKGAEWEGNDEFKDRLGNMTLLSEPLNKSVGSKSYSIKCDEYKKENRVKMTQDLIDNYPDFTKESIVKRQAELAEIALKVWNPTNIH